MNSMPFTKNKWHWLAVLIFLASGIATLVVASGWLDYVGGSSALALALAFSLSCERCVTAEEIREATINLDKDDDA